MRAQDSEDSLSLAQYREILLRRRWWILGTLFCVWAAAWVFSGVLPPRYRSETTILIDELQVPQHNSGEEAASGLQERLQTLTPQILSRTRLQQIIKDLNLYEAERGPGGEGLISQMRRDIKVQPLQVAGRPSELAAFTVSYSASNPALAQQVTRRLTSLFIEENVRTRAQRAQETTSFLDAQLQDARVWLQQQEARLQQFKAQYLGQLPSQMQANLAAAGTLDGRLQNAIQELQRAQQQKLYLSSLLAQYRQLRVAGSSASGPPAPPALDAELSRLRQQIDELRLRYTDEHPDLVRLRRQMARTEQLKVQIEKELGGGQRSEDLAPSSTTAQIQSQLQANEQEIRDRQSETAGIREEMRAVRARLRNTPVREQQLAELTRDYDQSRAYYDSLLAKRNQSQLASSLEKIQQGAQFRVLDPPSLPAAPYYPDRFKFSLAGLLLGLAAGGLTGYLRELLDDHFHSRTQIAGLCSAPVLAVIPPASGRRQSWLDRLRLGGEVAGATALLAIIASGTLLAFVTRFRD